MASTVSPWVTWDPVLQGWRSYHSDDVRGSKHERTVAPTIRDLGKPLDPAIRIITMRGSMASVEAMHRRFREVSCV